MVRPAASCGSGPPILEIGVDDPFQARPDGNYVIEQGFQGGHHIDVSVRLTGEMDPAHTDIELLLQDGDRELGRHVVADWILHPDAEARFCEYPRARIVFLDEEGALLSAERIPELLGRIAQLEVRLSAFATAKQSFDVTFTEIRSLNLLSLLIARQMHFGAYNPHAE